MAPKRRRQDKAQSKPENPPQKRKKLQHVNNAAAAATAETTSTSAQNSASDTTLSAAAQVFATTELLEQIFLSVDDVKSLMRMRRVAPQWRAVIDDTSSLKKKMWLAPQQPDHEWYLSSGADSLRKRPIASGAAAADSSDIIYKSGITNPFLFERPSIRRSKRPIWTSYFHNSWVSPPLFVHEEAQSSFRKARSLFLKMFATQPPIPVIYLRIRGDVSKLRTYRCLVEQVKNPKGVKVGDILRVMAHLSESQTSFVVDEMMFDLEQADDEINIQPYPFRRYGYEL